MVGLASGHGHSHHHQHHLNGHGLCSHYFKTRSWELPCRLPSSVVVSYRLGSPQSARVSPSYLALLHLKRKLAPSSHGRFSRNASDSECRPVLASQGEDGQEAISASSDRNQVPVSAPLKNISSDDGRNRNLTNPASSKSERSNRRPEKDEGASDAGKPENGVFERGNHHEYTGDDTEQDSRLSAVLFEDTGSLLSQISASKMNCNSNSNGRNPTANDLETYNDGLSEHTTASPSIRLTSELWGESHCESGKMMSQISTSKMNLDGNGLNENAIESTSKIPSRLSRGDAGEISASSSSAVDDCESDGSYAHGTTSLSTTTLTEIRRGNHGENGTTYLSQLTTRKMNLDSGVSNRNDAESMQTMPFGSSRGNSEPSTDVSYSATEVCESALAHLLASKNPLEFVSRFPAWADAQKESGMPQRQKRAFFSHEDWLQHRSTLRYVRHMLSSPSSRVIVSLVPPVFTFTVCAIIIAAYNSSVESGLLPSLFPLLHASSLPYELTAPALALLLVFRTDASYSRYDEARKTWTSVISVTKDFSRQTGQLIARAEDQALKSALLSYILAFPVALKCHLINGSDMRKELQVLLDKDDLTFVLASENRPNCLLQLMSRVLALVELENTERILLEGNIVQYNSSISVCERLIRTPIPLSYTRLTSRFLVLWHTSLPIVLWDSCSWLVVPATFLSATMLFYIEEVGVLIEEPFPMLALDKIIGVAHKNIHELIGLQQEADAFLVSKRKGNE